jgi:hypothetical protein
MRENKEKKTEYGERKDIMHQHAYKIEGLNPFNLSIEKNKIEYYLSNSLESEKTLEKSEPHQ